MQGMRAILQDALMATFFPAIVSFELSAARPVDLACAALKILGLAESGKEPFLRD